MAAKHSKNTRVGISDHLLRFIGHPPEVIIIGRLPPGSWCDRENSMNLRIFIARHVWKLDFHKLIDANGRIGSLYYFSTNRKLLDDSKWYFSSSYLTGRKTKCWKSIPTCFELIFILGGQSKLAANYVADFQVPTLQMIKRISSLLCWWLIIDMLLLLQQNKSQYFVHLILLKYRRIHLQAWFICFLRV